MPRRRLIVHVDQPELLDDLIDSLRRGGCMVRRAGPRSCSVEHTSADEHEARIELAFFLRAWRLRHGRVWALLAP